MEVTIQNLRQCLAILVESKQAAGAQRPVAQERDPSRGQVNDCRSSISGGFTYSFGGTNMCGLRCYFSWGYLVPVYTTGSVRGQGVFHSTVGDSYSQGRVVEPHKEGYQVYGASQPRSVRGEGHVMDSTPYFSKVGEFSY